MGRWKYQNGEVPSVDGKSIQWSLMEQGLLDGGVDVDLFVSVNAGGRVATSSWAGVTLTAAQWDDSLVVVTMSEIREACAQDDYRKARDLLDLLGTL